MLYTIEDKTLTALGDAVRNKVTGQSEPFKEIGDTGWMDYADLKIIKFNEDVVKSIKIKGTIKNAKSSSLHGSHQLVIVSGEYKYATSVRDIMTEEDKIPQISQEEEAVYEFEAYKEGNAISLTCCLVSNNPNNIFVSYEAIGLDENGNEFKYTPLEMVEKINNLYIPIIEPIVLTGANCDYGCAGPLAGTYINMFGNTISTKDITSGEKMFYYNNTVKKIPFDINFKAGTSETLQQFYANCNNLEEISLIHNVSPSNTSQMFYCCYRLREIPEGFGDDWNWNALHTGSYANASSVFDSCSSLRKIPSSFLNNMWTIYTSTYSTCYVGTFVACYVLDEINGVAVSPAAYTSNAFNNHLGRNHRLKNYTFQTNEDGTPKTAKWKSQTLDFSSTIGYITGGPTTASTLQYITGYNSGITADTVVTDDASYQALKDNPDWWTCDINYSRYNHDSAVATINSLPDCSATGTNTIKFKGASGALTDGGAINTLTEEEIAVAAAKGWTVSLV